MDIVELYVEWYGVIVVVAALVHFYGVPYPDHPGNTLLQSILHVYLLGLPHWHSLLC